MLDLSFLPEAVQIKVKDWLQGPIEEEGKLAIEQLAKNNPKELLDAFSCDLSFGTSGLRELIGVGPNRINIHTIAKATQAFANYLCREGKAEASVLIGYDTRNQSRLFACITAQVLAANGIKARLLNEVRPVPLVSFLIRFLGLDAGIMITASHNPKQYNGYKVYWSDGGEIAGEHEQGITKSLNQLSCFHGIKKVDLDHPLIEWMDADAFDVDYLEAIRSVQCCAKKNVEYGMNLQITYSSLHGAGIYAAPKALASWGFTGVHLVAEQVIPDGGFPTVQVPNPEEPEAFERGLKVMLASRSDILMINDGDADRIGIAQLHEGLPRIFNGNEFAALCAYHLCTSPERPLPPKAAFIISHVTTELIKVMAEHFGVACFEVFTGFKFIAEKMGAIEEQGYCFVLGAEESYGCLLGTYARDKDGIAADCFSAEMALKAKLEGKTLADRLYEIYSRFGVFREKQHSLRFPENQDGLLKRSRIMGFLREKPIRELAGLKVAQFEDYLAGEGEDYLNKKNEKLSMPRSDVILLRLEDGSKLIIRPSGTEAKLRIHIAVRSKVAGTVPKTVQTADHHIEKLLEKIIELTQKI